MFSSILQVLKVEEVASKTLDQATGKPFMRHYARGILLNESGEVNTVGRLRVPKALVEKLKVGTFTASFSLVVPDYGDDKGDIVAQLTDLTPVPGKQASAPAAASKGA